MQPLDRDNAHARRNVTAMQETALQQQAVTFARADGATAVVGDRDARRVGL